MAEAETNPVLQLIEMPLVENKKYPANLLNFQDLGWRAYYHCHPASRAGNHRFKGEHGHFHIFVQLVNKRATKKEWSHLVALAMDNMGQPLGWFTVNQWVTGEKWQYEEVLSLFLDAIPYDKLGDQASSKTALVETWLLSLLAVSQHQVRHVLIERDKHVEKIQSRDKNHDVKQDKGVYLLSQTPINLIELLDIDNNRII